MGDERHVAGDSSVPRGAMTRVRSSSNDVCCGVWLRPSRRPGNTGDAATDVVDEAERARQDAEAKMWSALDPRNYQQL